MAVATLQPVPSRPADPLLAKSLLALDGDPLMPSSPSPGSIRQRRLEITTMLHRDTEITVVELARRFAVSATTIRRDLQTLQADGLARRTHGGAVCMAYHPSPPSSLLRPNQAAPPKQAIADVAKTLIRDHETVIIDAGAPVLELARALRRRSGVTIVTPSVLVAAELSNGPQVRVMVTGGQLRPPEMSLVGTYAEKSFDDLNCCAAIITISGLDAERGMTEHDPDAARVKRAAIDASNRCIVIADAASCGRTAPITVAPLTSIDILLTDVEHDHPVVHTLIRNGTTILHLPVTDLAAK